MGNSGFMDELQLERSLEDLKQIQCELDGLELKHFEERKTLEKEHREKFQPLYKKRYEIVNGDSKVLKSSIESAIKMKHKPAQVKAIKSSIESAIQGQHKPAQDVGVPNFWLTVMKSNEVVAEMIQKHDEDALRYLKDIKWRRIQLSKHEYPQAKATGFKIEFFFDRNPYFRNPVLSKTYCMIDEDNDLLARAIGTEIKWFPRKCLTNIVLNKSKSSGGMITTAHDSFFNFFKHFEMLDADVDDIDEMAESVISLIKQDYNVGVNLKEDIIPHAVLLFTEENFDDKSGDIIDISNSPKNAKAMKSYVVRQNVKLLKEIQTMHDELEDMFFHARRDREDIHLSLCQPLFRKRYEIVNGIKPADQGEIKSGKGNGVPNFWLTALKANEVVAKLIHKQDEEVLKYVKDISWRKIRSSKADPNCCIELKFCFGANPYFRNYVLTKSYFIDDDYPFFSSLEDAIGTEIGWFAGKQLIGSFFDFFTLPGLPDYKDRYLRGEEWRSLMKLDYNVGLLICYDVIPHAVSLFTGEFEDTLRIH